AINILLYAKSRRGSHSAAASVIRIVLMPFPTLPESADQLRTSCTVGDRAGNLQSRHVLAVQANHPLRPDNTLAVAAPPAHWQSPGPVANRYKRRSGRRRRNRHWERNPRLDTTNRRSNNTIRRRRKRRAGNGSSTRSYRATRACKFETPYNSGLASFGFPQFVGFGETLRS